MLIIKCIANLRKLRDEGNILAELAEDYLRTSESLLRKRMLLKSGSL